MAYDALSLEERVAVVVGGTTGIGRTLSLGLARAGAHVVASSRRRAEVDAVAGEIEALGRRTLRATCDVLERASLERLRDEVLTAFGKLDILVNCAAMNRRKPIPQVTEDDWDTIMAVDLKSLYFMSQAAHAVMRAQGGGKIIHIGSLNSSYALGSVSVYGAAKGAVVQLTKVMGVEWAKDDVQVNCVIPGFVATPLSRPLWEQPYKAGWMRERIPMRRPARADETAGAVLMLSAPASSYITGTTVVVDGGVLAGGWWEPDDVLAKL
jgi:NAD(P)-dependent dehydrogenase (short-subunit alcohol dehydrogenase family)